ncbi:MAG: alpha/beta hydrolase [Actinomycetota bacterium]|nr:alpha/beta hydrolase [Actinomycetota bacterium]
MSDWSSVSSSSGQRFVFAESGDGPPVIFLHGFPDTPHSWERIARVVASTGYRTICPWLRGYHPDTHVAGRGYDAATIARDPIELLDAIGAEDAVLVGHDWGAAITYGAASLAPARVRALVAIAIPHPSLLPRNLGTLWAARHFAGFKMPWAQAMTRRRDFRYLDTLYHRWAPNWSGPLREDSLGHVKDCFREPTSLEAAIGYYRALTPKAPRELARPAAVRALIVGGAADIVPAALFAETAQRMGPGSDSLIVDGAGHWPHREGEELFLEHLLGFLATTRD